MNARTLVLLSLIALTGCPKAEEPPTPPSSPAFNVAQACGGCHTAPDPGVLPQARWRTLIPTMLGMPSVAGVPALTPADVDAAVAHYVADAPQNFAWAPPTAVLSSKLSFTAEGFTPPDERLRQLAMPSVANVNFVTLSDGKRKDLLISDMRTHSLMMLAPYRKGRGRRIRLLGKRLSYPVHSELADVNGDGRVDVLVASHGVLHPSNETKGAATVMIQLEQRGQFANLAIDEGLGRVTDVRGADLDGDGDLDVAVTAFGWRGPGKVLVYTNDGGSKFTGQELDDRDGAIHVEFADLNGDGKQDLVVLLSQEHEEVVAYMNKGAMKFERTLLHKAPHPAWGYSGLQLVDMDGDGDVDALVSNGDSLDDEGLLKPFHGVSWLENTGNLKFTERRIGALFGCERAVAADVDGDGDIDVVAVAFLPQLAPAVWREKDLDSVVWFEKTAAGWTPHAIEKHNCYHPTLAVADYDADGDLDIAVGNFAWLTPTGSGTAGKPTFRADYVTLFTRQ